MSKDRHGRPFEEATVTVFVMVISVSLNKVRPAWDFVRFLIVSMVKRSHGPSEAFQSQLEVKSFRKFCGQISKGVITLSQIKSYRSLGNNIFT